MRRSFHWLVRGVVAGCAFPGFDDLPWLHRAGVRVLVSLHPHLDGRAVTDAGLEWHELLATDLCEPTPEQMREFCLLVDDCRRRGKPVAVHCLAGIGRTGAMLAAYLVWTGRTAEEAIEAVRAVDARYIETEFQEMALDEFAQQMGRADEAALP